MVPYRYVLCACSLLAALSACSETREFMREKYTGERYGEPVTGPRRPPVLNPGYGQVMQQQREQAAMPVPEEVERKPATPYDQFDAKGNNVNRTNYLKEWFMPDEPTSTLPANRKSFKGIQPEIKENIPPVQPVIPREPVRKPVVTTEPVMLLPQGQEIKTPVVIVEPPAPEALPRKITPPASNEVTVPVTEQPPYQPPVEENGVMVPVVQLPITYTLAFGGGAPENYPHLATVPKTPERYDEIKNTNATERQKLKSSYDAVMEEKQRLGEEPSELHPVTNLPVEGRALSQDVAMRHTHFISGAKSIRV